MKIISKMAWMALLLSMFGGGLAVADERGQTLIIGEITDNPKKQINVLQPIVNYAVSKMGDVGITKAEVFMAKNLKDMVEAVKAGKVDWFTDSPLPGTLMMEQTGAEILVRRWKSGVGEYASLIFVHKDSGINSVEELKGKTVAFGDAASTTTYFIPVSIFREKGLPTAEVPSPRDKPAADKVGYLFAKEEMNIFTWVQRRLTDAGTASTSDWDDDSVKAMLGDLKIIHQTKPFPRAIDMVRKDLDPKVKAKLKEVLLGAAADPAAAEALKAYKKTKKFDEIAGESQAGMETAKQLLQNIRDML